MPKRFANHRLVKIHRNYSVEEIALTLKVHKNTVHTWIKDGLPTCDDRRPILILGVQLAGFLKARRTKNKQPCKLGEFYCLRCRVPRAPAEAMVDCLPATGKIALFQAICPDCFSMMNRRISLARLDQFRAIFVITSKKAREQVSDTTQPNVNSDFEKGAQDHEQTLS
jgi:hypothetical protein